MAPEVPPAAARGPWRLLAGAAAATAGIVALLVHLTLAAWRPDAPPGGEPQAAVEGCVRCHVDARDDPGGVHAAAVMGCASCHLGQRDTDDKEAAHAGMEREPGALDTAARTCGTCHARELERVRTSLMATARGVVAVNRFAFGEVPSPDGDETMADVLAAAAPTPAQDHLRRLCAGCHLGARRDNRDDAVQGIGAGCSACHVASRRAAGDPHPRVLGVVGDAQCLGCHSRSARISLSYQGLAEVAGPGLDGCAAPVELHDGRAGCRLDADVHHAAGLRCTDCHVHTELMGDGVARAHEELQTEVGCEACHDPAEAVPWAAVADPITRDLLRMRGEARPPEEPARVGRRGTPVWNLRPDGEGGWRLHAKGGGEVWPVKPTPADATHAMPGHGRLACAACHAAWAPTCTTCHTTYDPDGEQWDFGRAAPAPGAWIETNDGMGHGPPALGVRPDGTVMPAVPGMIARLDARPAGGPDVGLRRFSMFDPHTTGRRARTCASCHRSAWALGLGEGDLDLDGDAVAFRPARPGADPSGPAEDGWTTLFPAVPGEGTRVGARSLDAAEQRRVLRVGACLPCHPSAEDPVWRDLEGALARLRGGATACEGRPRAWMDAGTAR